MKEASLLEIAIVGGEGLVGQDLERLKVRSTWDQKGLLWIKMAYNVPYLSSEAFNRSLRNNVVSNSHNSLICTWLRKQKRFHWLVRYGLNLY